MVKVRKNDTVREIPKEYLDVFIKAGWEEVKDKPKK